MLKFFNRLILELSFIFCSVLTKKNRFTLKEEIKLVAYTQ